MDKCPLLGAPTYLLLRDEASWAHRPGVVSSAFGTDPILAVPKDTGAHLAEGDIHDALAPTSVLKAPKT